jgi:hypothetical protein
MKFASMRDPQVVFWSRVQKMSLWASGTPVSGPASCARSRASALAASASAASALMLMNAFRSA